MLGYTRVMAAHPTRTHFLLLGAGAVAAAGLLRHPRPAAADGAYAVTHSDAEWRRILSPEAYDVMRHEGT
jgi:peptide-methionine (R)-S-oxide reductase